MRLTFSHNGDRVSVDLSGQDGRMWKSWVLNKRAGKKSFGEYRAARVKA